MSPVYLNPPPSSPIPFLDQFKGDVAAATSFSYLDKSHNNASDHEGLAIDYSWHPQDKVERVLSHDKPNDGGQLLQSSSWPQNYMGEGSSGCNYAHQTSNHYGESKIKIVTNNEQKQSKRWKPSKVRIMQKMMTTSKNIGDHKLQHNLEQQRNQSNTYRNNNNNNNNGIRICADCHTTTTPLWRSGPQGPKSLCNACGIRQRKARRAAMAAAEIAKEGIASSSSSLSGESLKPQVYEQEEREIRRSDHHENHPLPLKKRGKIAFHHQVAKPQRAFPRDEEEGAILLMALSCGLACSS